MESVYEELDEAKAEIIRLREQYRAKSELADGLKKAHDNQLVKNKEANSTLEKLVQELNEKNEAISTTSQLIEELKSNISSKESSIRNISSAHDKLRIDCTEKLQKFDEENKALALALDDANAKIIEQEERNRALLLEIEGVRRLLNVSKKKCLETENRREEMGERDDVFHELKEENRKFEDQLKWKKEQFAHLEEAHRKLRNEFKSKEKEWEKDKNALLDEISSLQTNLESQMRISKDLQQRLEMCNQALAHAESKRKVLEAELYDSRTSFNNMCAEYDEAKSNLDILIEKRDQEIANLRSSLGTKEILYKEMEYQFRKLEQEKQELLLSMKEQQEDRIHGSGRLSSASKLQNKLKSLEQAHKGCSAHLRAKESEWQSQLEKLTVELNNTRLESQNKDLHSNELKIELETCDSLILKLELMNQETSLMLLILESEFSEAQIRFNSNNDKLERNISGLLEQLEKKKAAFNLVQKDLEEERIKVVLLSERVQSLEELQFPLQKEMDRLKEMLKASSTCKLKSEEEVARIQGDLRKVHAALDRANQELYEKACEANEIEFELQIWKSIAEQMEADLNQNLHMRKELEASLLSQMEFEVNLKQEKESLSCLLEQKEKKIDNLQQQLLEQNESEKMEEMVDNDKESLHQLVEEKDQRIYDLSCLLEQKEKKIDNLQQQLVEQNENAKMEEMVENDKESLHQLVEEKDQRIYDLQQLVASLEHEFDSSMSSFSSKLSQMQEEMDLLRESLEKIKTNGVLKEMEIQEKTMMITELENDVGNLLEKVGHQEKSLAHSAKKIQEIQAEFERKETEKSHRLQCEVEENLEIIKKINQEKMKMVEDRMRLSSDNQALVNSMDLLSERIKDLSMEDMKLVGNLENIIEMLEIERDGIGLDWIDEHDPVKENNTMMSFSPSHSSTRKVVDTTHEERSPLRTLNN